MNIVVYKGRLTADPVVRYTGQKNTACANINIAVSKSYHKEGEPTADFFNCVAFGKNAENIEKYFKKGSEIVVIGENHNNDYVNKDGQKVRQDVMNIAKWEFCGNKSDNGNAGNFGNVGGDPMPMPSVTDEFMQIPIGGMDELPFS